MAQAFLVLLPLTVSCVGDIGDGAITDPNAGPLCESPNRVVARRLSRVEYNNTMRDLFDFDVGNPMDALPDDVVGASGLTASDLFLEKHEEVAAGLAASAVNNGFINCDPSVDARGCAYSILEPFMARAWRRPVSSEEVEGVLTYLDVVASEPGEPEPFPQAIRLGIQHVLMSPSFLFRFEPLPDATSDALQPLSSYQMASRLSYFIYGSMPDSELFEAAASDRLTDPREIEAQVVRMLASDKGAAFVDKLIDRWLSADRIALLNPDPAVYPSFDPALRSALREELRLFVREFIAEDRSYKDMLDADFTYVNKRLAEHYGLPGAAQLGDGFTRVSLADVPERGGLLTLGAVLAATSVPHNDPTAEVRETNVIVRGRFVLQELLCFPLPSPPANLDVNKIQAEAQMNIPDTAPRKEREGVRQQTQPCATCHAYLDPIGFSMEHFDITGAYRTVDTKNTEVDSTGLLPSETGAPTPFSGAHELGSVLKEDPRIGSCFTGALVQLAIDRDLSTADACAIDDLAQQAEVSGSGLRSLIVAIATSPTFTQQRGDTP